MLKYIYIYIYILIKELYTFPHIVYYYFYVFFNKPLVLLHSTNGLVFEMVNNFASCEAGAIYIYIYIYIHH